MEWMKEKFPIDPVTLEHMNLPQRFHQLSYDRIGEQSFAESCHEFVKTWVLGHGESLFIRGPIKTGKTTAVTCMMRQLCTSEKAVPMYVSFSDLLEYKINKTMLIDRTPAPIWEKCFLRNFLVIDNFGYEDFDSGIAAKLILRLIRERSDNSRTTILVSDLDNKKIEDKYNLEVLKNIFAKMMPLESIQKKESAPWRA